jgi:hypothetical protein
LGCFVDDRKTVFRRKEKKRKYILLLLSMSTNQRKNKLLQVKKAQKSNAIYHQQKGFFSLLFKSKICDHLLVVVAVVVLSFVENLNRLWLKMCWLGKWDYWLCANTSFLSCLKCTFIPFTVQLTTGNVSFSLFHVFQINIKFERRGENQDFLFLGQKMIEMLFRVPS